MPLTAVVLWDLNALTQSSEPPRPSLFNSTTCLESIQTGSSSRNKTDTFDTVTLRGNVIGNKFPSLTFHDTRL